MDAEVAKGEAAVAVLVGQRSAGIRRIKLAAEMIDAHDIADGPAAGDFQRAGDKRIAQERVADADRLARLLRRRRDAIAVFDAGRQRLFDQDVTAAARAPR